MKNLRFQLSVALLLAAVPSLVSQSAAPVRPNAASSLQPATMKPVAHVSDRFQSFNVEMVEVTGGRFWAPYKPAASGPAAAPDSHATATPGGVDATRFRYRAPLELGNPKLVRLARALAPSYIRVSGTWANSTYFDDSGASAPSKAPEGFGGVLTASQWQGVLDFSKAADAEIVTSFAISPGVRSADGLWTPVQAEKLVAYTRAHGGHIALAEYFNEPTFAAMGGAPKGYDAASYGRDFKIFANFLRKASPGTLIVGPDSVGDGPSLADSMKPKSGHAQAAPAMAIAMPSHIRTEDMLTAEGPNAVDGFAYHFYGGVSQRCRGANDIDADPAHELLKPEWLSRTDREEAFYQKLRDKYEPGKPMWLTETAEAACGGDPWASTFVDSFRYLHQLGALARVGVQSVMHNTLAASDYGLIDESTLEPRPNYWSALLWARLMGPVVLDPAVSPAANQYVYAHCLKGTKGGVALLVLNADHDQPQSLELSTAAERYTLSADDLMGRSTQLNGNELKLTPSGDLPVLSAQKIHSGRVTLPPASISFFAIPGASNSACM